VTFGPAHHVELLDIRAGAGGIADASPEGSAEAQEKLIQLFEGLAQPIRRPGACGAAEHEAITTPDANIRLAGQEGHAIDRPPKGAMQVE
jgi:hypothetical protein